MATLRHLLEYIRLQEDYKTAKQKFMDTAKDEAVVADALNYYKTQIQQGLRDPNEKNIDWWAQQGWNEFFNFVNVYKDVRFRDELVLRDDNEWLILVPLNHKSSCYHGSNTRWCISKEHETHFAKYFFDRYRTIVFCYSKSKKTYWAVVFNHDYTINQIQPPENTGMTQSQFESITGLQITDIIDLVKNNHQEINRRRVVNSKADISGMFDDFLNTQGAGRDPRLERWLLLKKNKKLIAQYIEVLQNRHIPIDWPAGVALLRDKKEEQAILASQDPEKAYEYATRLLGVRWPEGEDIIATDPKYAYYYAKYVIKGRWPEGEDIIATDSVWAMIYAKDVIKGRWPEAEDVIAKDPFSASGYAMLVIKGRWQEAEDVIATDPEYAYYYAASIIKGRWPEGEDAIAKDPEYAYRYARDVIKGRWPEAENTIATEPGYAYQYAKYVIQGRWPEAEPAIAKSSVVWSNYKKHFNLPDDYKPAGK